MTFLPHVPDAKSHDEAEAIERRHVAAVLRHCRAHIDAMPIHHIGNVEIQALLRTLGNEAHDMQEQAEELERDLRADDATFEAWTRAGMSTEHPDYSKVKGER